MLSVFITPWMNPTFIHCATSAACRLATASSIARKGCGASRSAGSCRASVYSASRRRLCTSPREAKNSKVPTRMWLAATRVRMAPGSDCSRWTGSPVAATASARVVGMPSTCIASPTSTSRSMGPIAALPSPPRANGVRPDPLKAMSRRRPCRSITSPSSNARPSPSCGENPPNWWPAYTCASGSAPSGSALPVNTAALAGPSSDVTSRPISAASERLR